MSVLFMLFVVLVCSERSAKVADADVKAKLRMADRMMLLKLVIPYGDKLGREFKQAIKDSNQSTAYKEEYVEFYDKYSVIQQCYHLRLDLLTLARDVLEVQWKVLGIDSISFKQLERFEQLIQDVANCQPL